MLAADLPELEEELSTILDDLRRADDVTPTRVSFAKERILRLVDRLEWIEDSLSAMNADRTAAVNIRDIDWGDSN